MEARTSPAALVKLLPSLRSIPERPETWGPRCHNGRVDANQLAEPGPVYGPASGPAPVEPHRPRPFRRRAGGALAALLVVVLKLGAKLKALVLVLPKLKILSTSGTMLVSIAAYAVIWGWRFAIGFVLLLLVHELGHVIQLRREGIKASAPMFIPFLGAVVAMRELPKDAAAEARVGLAGPVLGSVGTLVPLAVWQATGSELFQALAFVGFFLNLFNLLPVLPLDGGRAMAALSPAVWIVGYAALAVLAVLFPNPVMLLVLVLGGFETWRRWRERGTPEGQAFHRVAPMTRLAVACVYIGLAAALGVAVSATHLERTL
jgi:Zn-dependent protease